MLKNQIIAVTRVDFETVFQPIGRVKSNNVQKDSLSKIGCWTSSSQAQTHHNFYYSAYNRDFAHCLQRANPYHCPAHGTLYLSDTFHSNRFWHDCLWVSLLKCCGVGRRSFWITASCVVLYLYYISIFWFSWRVAFWNLQYSWGDFFPCYPGSDSVL